MGSKSVNSKKSILCYGDSNTWGFIPTADYAAVRARFPREVRWPGCLQALLGESYYVIEEGLNGRTTNLNHITPPDRNGKTYLPSCLYSHAPLDLVILLLGGNDLKAYFNRTPHQICEGMRELIDIIQTSLYGQDMQSAPRILLLSQPIPLPISETFLDEQNQIMFPNAVEKSIQLNGLYQQLAQEKQVYFLDIAESIQSSEIDGGHLDAENHMLLARLVANAIESILAT